jgi:hypothetical protein
MNKCPQKMNKCNRFMNIRIKMTPFLFLKRVFFNQNTPLKNPFSTLKNPQTDKQKKSLTFHLFSSHTLRLCVKKIPAASKQQGYLKL